jgi:hypothetical protein
MTRKAEGVICTCKRRLICIEGSENEIEESVYLTFEISEKTLAGMAGAAFEVLMLRRLKCFCVWRDYVTE